MWNEERDRLLARIQALEAELARLKAALRAHALICAQWRAQASD